MLIGGVFALMAMATVGSAMANYAWREAQWEEVRAAVRAAISAAGPLLSGAGDPATNLKIANRVAAFAEAGLSGFNVGSGDVTVAHDSGTGVTTITVSGTYTFSDLWTMGNAGGNRQADSERVSVTIRSKLDSERYEVAIALDISQSMRGRFASGNGGQPITRLDGLKTALGSVADAMQSATDTTPGSMLVSLVPYATAVRVADTAGRGRTPSKERYVRLLAGVPTAGGTIADTLRAARRAGRQGWGHWVDGFHHYGVGDDLGPLRKRTLPRRLLNDRSWNLRRTGVSVDVSDQVPGFGTWVVNDEDFWNGCVMARWGAYWDPRARPAGWTPAQASNWPATRAVAGWSARSPSLPGTTPLHLSDAPPSAGDRNTLFTAYSWPDARIGGHADHRLQTIMATLVEAPTEPTVFFGRHKTPLKDRLTKGDNDWSAPGSGGGATLCPPSAITPLTDDLASLRQAVNGLQTHCAVAGSCGNLGGATGTYVHLGVVWALRSLSPLWQRLWQVQDLQGAARPKAPCAPNEADAACDSRLNKSILIVSDGENSPGLLNRTRLGVAADARSPTWQTDVVCHRNFLSNYHAAAAESTSAGFNSRFSAYLDQGRFGGAGLDEVLDAFNDLDALPDLPARRDLRKALLTTLTPWQLFRGLDAGVTDALMDGANEFGFEHRPVQTEHFCRPNSIFTPYGRVDDYTYVGHSATLPSTPLPPVTGVSPFNLAGMPQTSQENIRVGGPVFNRMTTRLNQWFRESCRIAGERRVRINAIFIGNSNRTRAIKLLEECIDAAGGTPGVDEVFVTPDAQTLKTAFVDLFTVRRNLRFLN